MEGNLLWSSTMIDHDDDDDDEKVQLNVIIKLASLGIKIN